MASRLTSKQANALRAMGRNESLTTPTEIGQACGVPYHKASSWALGALKALIHKDYVASGSNGYKLTRVGRRRADELIAAESGGGDGDR